jgi:hypothetical protein
MSVPVILTLAIIFVNDSINSAGKFDTLGSAVGKLNSVASCSETI